MVVTIEALSTGRGKRPQRPYTKSMNELQSRCYSLASDLAAEINGDLDCVPQEDIDSLLAGVTPENMEETAGELAHLAYWFN